MTDIVERIQNQIKMAESAQTFAVVARVRLEYKAFRPELKDIEKRVRASFGKPIEDLDLYVLAGDSHGGMIKLYHAIIAAQDRVQAMEEAVKRRNQIKSTKSRNERKVAQIRNDPISPETSNIHTSFNSTQASNDDLSVFHVSQASNDDSQVFNEKQASNDTNNHNGNRNLKSSIPKGSNSPAGSEAILDAEVAKVVNQVSKKLHLERAPSSAPKKESTPSLSGNYWVGPPDSHQAKLCFCRILNNNVMVRVGGGWDHLSTFLNRHFGYLASSPPDSPTQSRIATPERYSPDQSFRSEGSMRELSMSLSPESIKHFLRKQGSA